MSDGFQFDTFYVQHAFCAMKVGTDATLLGNWCKIPANLSHVEVLDIGTGSGVLSLMLAERLTRSDLSFHIDAIDMDFSAYEQATQNAQQSIYKPFISVLQTSFQSFSPDKVYQIIICNPPFFSSLLPPDTARQNARHTNNLTMQELAKKVSDLLAPKGLFSVILPFEQLYEALYWTQINHLYPTHITKIYTTETPLAKRVLMAFAKNYTPDFQITSQTV